MIRRIASVAALVLASVGAGLVAPAARAETAPPPPPEHFAVVAHIDSGINPYHRSFRDHSPLAYEHPSTYIPGYPADTPALELSLDERTWEAAFAKDKAKWDALRLQVPTLKGKMFWIPGTRIIGAVFMTAGGVYCPPVPGVELAPNVVNAPGCVDYPILDDHGHGTMTASRMAGQATSLCGSCRIVSIEGLGHDSVAWAADRGWIDVQTNSWGYLVPDPVISVGAPVVTDTIEAAAAKHLVYFASGNGVNFFAGVAPWPTQLGPTLVDGAIWVGAHDNGRVSPWSGAPPHVVTDGYAGLSARHRELSGRAPTPFACCTSASSPYAAGEGAMIALRARKLLDDNRTGVRNGVVAEGTPAHYVGPDSPLADGVFTLDELKAVVLRTAEARPAAGVHDGNAHWLSEPRPPELLPHGFGSNPYCPGCYTLPVQWTQVPDGAPAHVLVGYGAVNERAMARAGLVLLGSAAPDRSAVDEFFAQEAAVRRVVRHPLG